MADARLVSGLKHPPQPFIGPGHASRLVCVDGQVEQVQFMTKHKKHDESSRFGQ